MAKTGDQGKYTDCMTGLGVKPGHAGDSAEAWGGYWLISAVICPKRTIDRPRSGVTCT